MNMMVLQYIDLLPTPKAIMRWWNKIFVLLYDIFVSYHPTPFYIILPQTL